MTKLLVLFCASSAGVCVLVCLVVIPAEPTTAILHVDSAQFQLGSVYVTEAVPVEIAVKNTSSDDAIVNSVAMECGCLSVDSTFPLLIERGKTRVVRFILDTSKSSKDGNGGFRTRFAFLSANRELMCPPAALTGSLRWALRISSPDGVHFDGPDILTVGQRHSGKSVSIEPLEELHKIELRCDPDTVTAKLDKCANDERYILTVTPPVLETQQSFSAVVRLDVVTAEGRELTVPLTVDGHSRWPVQFSSAIEKVTLSRTGNTQQIQPVLNARNGIRFRIHDITFHTPMHSCFSLGYELDYLTDTKVQCNIDISLCNGIPRERLYSEMLDFSIFEEHSLVSYVVSMPLVVAVTD